MILALTAATGAMTPQVAAQTAVRYTVAPSGNEARYYVREQLARFDFPNDAVGLTSRIEGGISIDEAGAVIADESRFVIDLASLESDSDRRDGFLRRNTLRTAEHPTAVFVPTAFDPVPPLDGNADVTFRIAGNLTIRGVTRPVTWDATARVTDDVVIGEARTSFTFADFEIEKPRVAAVLSVADDIRLEYVFVLMRAEQMDQP